MKILTPEQLREVDRLSSEKHGIPSLILMENAGMRVVEVLEDRFENLDELTSPFCAERETMEATVWLSPGNSSKRDVSHLFFFSPRKRN